jgi:hypothetical protein
VKYERDEVARDRYLDGRPAMTAVARALPFTAERPSSSSLEASAMVICIQYPRIEKL